MAEPFQPKFVDLVRNFTSTEGTGNFVLDGAVTGFTSFGAAVQPGDSFYYSVGNLEQSSEREVGRGTMQPDGTISRDAISGILTNFSSGLKTIALIAAAEWYSRIETAPAVAPVSTRTALGALTRFEAPAMLSESGREGLFVWKASDLSAEVSADTGQGIYVASSSDITGASGAWVRQFEGPVNPEWFGVVKGAAAGANAAGNDSAFTAIKAVLAQLAGSADGVHQGVPAVEFGFGEFEFSATWDLDVGTLLISGQGAGHLNADSAQTTLRFHDCTGIRVQHRLTSGASTVDAVIHPNGSYSVISKLYVRGNYTSAEAEHHGIHARGTPHCYNVKVGFFAGDGFRIEADAGNGDANIWRLLHCSAISNRDGFHVTGNNVNVGNATGLHTMRNRRWGVYDDSSLGNCWTSVHGNANGYSVDGSSPSSVVHYNNHRYFVIDGQAGWCSTNPPSGGTGNNQGWAYLSAGGAVAGQFPDWVTGTIYRAGGWGRTTRLSAPNQFIGCYAEGNQGKTQFVALTTVEHGTLRQWTYDGQNAGRGPAPSLGTDSTGTWVANTGYTAKCGTVESRIGELGTRMGNGNFVATSMSEPAVSPLGHGFRFETTLTGNNLLFTYNGSSSSTVYQFLITGPNTTERFGSGTAVPHSVYIPRLMIGDVRGNGRQITNGTAAPTSGSFGIGSFSFDRTNDPNKVGRKCITGGTPGSWSSELYALNSMAMTLSGLTVSATDVLLGRSGAGAGAVQEVACTAAGRALLDDADAAAQRATLELGTGATRNIHVGTTAPASPAVNDLWVDLN